MSKENPFDIMAAEWDQDSMKFQIAVATASAVLKRVHLSPGAHLLDFGCGTGLVSFNMMKENPDITTVTGLDNSSGMIDIFNQKAQEAQIDAKARLYDLTEELPEKEYDLAVSSMVFHHLPEPLSALQEIAKSLKPGATVAIADLDVEDGTFHPPEMTGIFHHGFDRSEMEEWFKKAGFEQVSSFTIHEVPKSEKVFPIFMTIGQKPRL